MITEHAMREFHIQAITTDWLLQGTQPFTAAQISNAELAASTTQLSVESKNDQPTSFAVITWATIFGIVVALGVLGMSVGLVRSETASDLRTLAATGASSYTRRTLTAATAGSLGFLGALLGTVGGYVALIGWLRSNSLNGGIAALGNVPVARPAHHSARHAGLRGDRRLGLRRPRAGGDGASGDRVKAGRPTSGTPSRGHAERDRSSATKRSSNFRRP